MLDSTKTRVAFAALVASLIAAAFIVSAWSLTANTAQNPQPRLYFEITPSQSNQDASFSFLLEDITLGSQPASTTSYTLSANPNGTLVQIHIRFNNASTFRASLNDLTAKSPASAYPAIFKEIPTSTIQRQNLTVYIEYSAQSSWLFGSFPLYRDAYLYGPGYDSAVSFSATETPQLFLSLAGGTSIPVSAVIVAFTISDWRRRLLGYFPWLTFALSFIMLWGFIFIGTPTAYEHTLGILPDIFSSIPHFSTDHLLGNLTRGFILAGILLETWVGYAEQSLYKRRFQLLAAMFLMDSSSTLISLLGTSFSLSVLEIGGFGASYTVEVWASLLMIAVISEQRILGRTQFLSQAYPFLAGLAGFALLNYVYEWFLAGFVIGGSAETVALATNHIIAFLLGLLIIGLFYGVERLLNRSRLDEQSSTSEQGELL